MAVTVVRTGSIDTSGFLTTSSASTNYATKAELSNTNSGLSQVMNNFYSFSANPTSFKNKLINGGFDIWQRGTGTPIGELTYTNTYVADRWKTISDFGISYHTYEKTAATDELLLNAGILNYIAFSSMTYSGDNNQYLEQKIEDVRTLTNKTVTLSFYAKAGVSTSFTPRFIQNFGSGGSTSVTTNTSAITLTTSWARYSVTTTIPSVAGKTIGDDSFLAVHVLKFPESVDIDITGVQLEIGSSATPFEVRPIGIELPLCQRYYNILLNDISQSPFMDGYQAANGYITSYISFPSMRKNPSLGVSWGTTSNVSTYNAISTGNNTLFLYIRASALGRAYMYIEYITLDAEL